MTKKHALAASLFLLGLALMALIVPAFYARFMADDYCMNAGAQNAALPGFFNSVYTGWSGRFAYIASTYYLSKIPPQAFGVLVAVIVLLWVYNLARAFKAIAQLFRTNLGWIEGFILAFILLIALFKTAPNLYQDLYWRDGLVNYTLPLVFTSLTLLLAVNIFQTRLTWVKALFLVITAFLSAGFSESASIANLTFWVVICVFCLFLKHPRKKAILISSGIPALASMLGFLIEFLAPGNLVRAGILPDRPGIIVLAGLTLRNVAHLYGRLLIYGFPWVLISLLTGLYLGYISNLDSKINIKLKDMIPMRSWFIGAALVNFLVGSGVCAAVAYLMKAYPDDRIIIIPYFFALTTILITGLLFGSWLHSPLTANNNSKNFGKLMPITHYALVALTTVLAFALMINLVKSLPSLVNYAHRWDERDALIRSELAAGMHDLVIPGLESRYGLPDLQLEKEDWVNLCTAGYYRASSITGK